MNDVLLKTQRARDDPKYRAELIKSIAWHLGVNKVPARAGWKSSAHVPVYTVDAAAGLLRVSAKRVHNILSLHRRRFHRRYRRAKNHPRRLRVLTPRDIWLVASLSNNAYMRRLPGARLYIRETLSIPRALTRSPRII